MRWSSACLLVLGAIALGGCVVERETTAFRPGLRGLPPADQRQAPGPGTGTSPGEARGDSTDGRGSDEPGEPVVLTSVHAELTPLGIVPYDEFALPLVEPGGTMVATQVGVPPYWTTIVAAPDAPFPRDSSVRVYRLGFEQDQRGALVHHLPRGTLLGRDADDTGFLVEQMFEDGSRSIGKTAWRTGEVTWLADDGNVNAFGSLGPDGWIAWSTRPHDRDTFDLVARRGDREVFIPSTEEWSWLMPSFSTDGRWLFALRLRDGVLTLVAFPLDLEPGLAPMHPAGRGAKGALHAQADTNAETGVSESTETPESTRQVATAEMERMEAMPLSMRADAQLAYQVMAPVQGTSLARLGGSELVFYDPRVGGMATWNPDSGRCALVAPRSFGAVAIDRDRLVAGIPEGPVVVRLPARDRTTAVADGVYVPRPSGLEEWPCLLLSPADRQILIFGLRVPEA